MILVQYLVTCDGDHPHIADEQCEAEFTYTAASPNHGLYGLVTQFQQRGWRVAHGKAYCPVHQEPGT